MPTQRGEPEVGRGEHAEHTGSGARRARVDGDDPAVRDGRSDEHRVQARAPDGGWDAGWDVGEEVGKVPALPSQQRTVLDPEDHRSVTGGMGTGRIATGRIFTGSCSEPARGAPSLEGGSRRLDAPTARGC